MAKNRLKQYDEEMVDMDDPVALTAVPKAKPDKKEVPVKEKKEEPQAPKISNPLAGKIETKPEGKSYGFYLSNEAVEKLEKLAQQNNCSKSKALDLLLRSVL